MFTLLSLAVEREPLQIAYWALLGEDAALRGTALEYLENVLPEDVGARSGRTSACAPRRPPGAAAQQIVQELLRSSDEPRLQPDALKRILPRR